VPGRAPRRPTTPAGRVSGGEAVDDDHRGLPPPVEPELAPGEELQFVLRGIGSTLFLTSDHLIVARDGPERRPRSGTQSFPLESISHIRVQPGERPSGRVAVWIGPQEVVSMFFDGRSADRANEAVAAARRLIARRRRERQGSGRRTSG
jgi:hypothetical protein